MLKLLQKGKLRLVLAVLPFVMVACSTKVGPAEAYKGESPKQIFDAGEADMQKGDFTEAIKRFEALDVQYPEERQTELAEVHLIYAYYRKEEYGMAEAAAARFTRSHPLSYYTDYAYFMQGMSEYYQNQGALDRIFAVDLAKRENTRLKKAYKDFSKVVDAFPNSRYAPASYQYMVYLRNLLAKHQLQTAQFYYARKAYIAAINRANNVIVNYEGSPSVPPALVVMAKSYHALHLSAQEREVKDLLQTNYPGSSYAREVR